MGPNPHLWILDAKQPILKQKNTSPWVPDLTSRYVFENSVISTRITCLYGSQPLSVSFACKTACFAVESKVCVGSSYHLSFSACKTA